MQGFRGTNDIRFTNNILLPRYLDVSMATKDFYIAIFQRYMLKNFMLAPSYDQHIAHCNLSKLQT